MREGESERRKEGGRRGVKVKQPFPSLKIKSQSIAYVCGGKNRQCITIIQPVMRKDNIWFVPCTSLLIQDLSTTTTLVLSTATWQLTLKTHIK